MARVLSVRSIRELLYALGVALCAAALLLFPVQSVAAAKSGLQLCGNVIARNTSLSRAGLSSL